MSRTFKTDPPGMLLTLPGGSPNTDRGAMMDPKIKYMLTTCDIVGFWNNGLITADHAMDLIVITMDKYTRESVR